MLADLGHAKCMPQRSGCPMRRQALVLCDDRHLSYATTGTASNARLRNGVYVTTCCVLGKVVLRLDATKSLCSQLVKSCNVGMPGPRTQHQIVASTFPLFLRVSL